MGVPWGIVAYPAEYDREELIAAWLPLALSPEAREFSVMRGNDRLDFLSLSERAADGKRGVTITTVQAPDMRVPIDALRTGDGNYDLFERMFDGYELFVPWSTVSVEIEAPGSGLHGKRWQGIDSLLASMRDRFEEFDETPPEDEDLERLARELFAAARVAKKLRMLIQISF